VSLITLTSDYGKDSPYIAAVKGAIYCKIPDANIVDICHSIPPFNVKQAAFILRNTCKNFPKGTWHIICIDTNIKLHKQFLVIEKNEHFFIAADNGIFSLLFDEVPNEVQKISESNFNQFDLFPEKNLFINVVKAFLDKSIPEGMTEKGKVKNIQQSLKPTKEGNTIKGAVMYLDGFQNAITNIDYEMFNSFVQNRPFKIFYRRKLFINKISRNFSDHNAGDEVALFNENGHLIITMERGHGAQLLGIRPESIITIEIDN